ncbi:MAG: hypothetical protein Q8R32_01870, partial [bacterium]|nr:hypothetical protein [bacterium]
PFYLHDERAIEAADEFWVFGLSKEVLVKLKHALRCGKPVYLLYLEFDDDWRLHREEVLIPALNMLDAINLPVYAELRDEIELHFLF